MNILVLSPYPPYPPHGGGTMRIYQLVRGLAARHNVTCLAFSPSEQADAALEPLRAVCRLVTVRGPARRSVVQRAWTTAASPLPDMALRNQSAAFAAAVRQLLAQEQFDIAQAESIEMAPYLELVRATTNQTAVVLDQFNAEFVLQKRAAQTSAAALRSGMFNPAHVAGAAYSFVQWLKLARYERAVMRRCDLVLAVSEDDRQTLLGLDARLNIGVVPNGVDTGVFSRAALAEQHAGVLSFTGPAIIFTGTLDFRPNVDAVFWFAHEVMPLIRATWPDARFVVVGKRPGPALRALPAEIATVVGEVPDARPFIAASSVYVVPMRIGGGVRLKLLEALSLEAPVVSTGMGAEGVEGLRDHEHCLLADEPHAFASATLRLLHEAVLGERLGASGRALVQKRYDWDMILPRLEALYQHL